MNKATAGITPFILFLAFLALGYFGVYDQWNKLGEARVSYDAAKEETESLRQAQADVNRFLDEYNSTRDKAPIANRALPKGDSGVAILLDNFAKLAQESGMTLRQINIENNPDSSEAVVPSPNTLQPVDFDIQVNGSFEAFREFLIKTQTNLRITDILSVNVSEDTGEEGSTGMKYSLRLRSYYQQ